MGIYKTEKKLGRVEVRLNYAIEETELIESKDRIKLRERIKLAINKILEENPIILVDSLLLRKSTVDMAVKYRGGK